MLLHCSLLAALAGPGSQDAESRDDWTIHAERVHTSSGETIENALIQVENGKIRSILAGRSAPAGGLAAKDVTAGMIDASVRISAGDLSVEQSTEVQPHRDVSASVDPFDYRFARQARSGVSTVLVSPLDQNVVGGLGVVLKTAGPESTEARKLASRGIVRGAIGTQPSRRNSPAALRATSFYNRRPTTRMGVEWEWRKAFYDAVAATRIPERDYPGSEILRSVLAGELTLMIQAWTTQDIRTAVFLKEEMAREGFGEIDLVIDAGAEAWKDPQLLVRTEADVVLPPFSGQGRIRTGDNAFMAWNTPRVLIDAGLRIALSSHGARSNDARLAAQAGYAMRGGLTFEEALAAVTIVPARMLGVEQRVGSIEVGKDADLVLWNGPPFEPSTGITGVLIDGRLIVDPRPDE